MIGFYREAYPCLLLAKQGAVAVMRGVFDANQIVCLMTLRHKDKGFEPPPFFLPPLAPCHSNSMLLQDHHHLFGMLYLSFRLIVSFLE